MNARNPHRRQRSRVYQDDIGYRRWACDARRYWRNRFRLDAESRTEAGRLYAGGWRGDRKVTAGERLRTGDLVSLGDDGRAYRARAESAPIPDGIYLRT